MPEASSLHAVPGSWLLLELGRGSCVGEEEDMATSSFTPSPPCPGELMFCKGTPESATDELEVLNATVAL